MGLSKSRLHLMQTQSEANIDLIIINGSEETLVDTPGMAEFDAEEDMVDCVVVVVSMDKLSFVEFGVSIAGGPDKVESLEDSRSGSVEVTELVAK